MVKKIENLYFKLIMCFALTTLIAKYVSFINKMLFGVLIVVQILLYLCSGIRKKDLCFFIIFIAVNIFAILSTTFPLYNINDIFYFPYMILFYLYWAKNRERVAELLKNNAKFFNGIILIWSGLVLISMFIPSSYTISSAGRFFCSFSGDTFRLAPTAIFIISMSYFLIKCCKQRNALLYVILPLCCIFMGGSRTYLGVAILMLLVIIYDYWQQKYKFWLLLLPMIAIIIYILLNSAIGEKFVFALRENIYFDFWGTFTSSRSVFWKDDMVAFFKQPFVNQLLGSGFNFVYEVNIESVEIAIWAHNDFIQILTTFGYVGLILYIVCFVKLFRSLKKTKVKNRFCFFAVLMVWIFNAFFNMFYTYFCSMICYPIFVSAYLEGNYLSIKNEYQVKKINIIKFG